MGLVFRVFGRHAGEVHAYRRRAQADGGLQRVIDVFLKVAGEILLREARMELIALNRGMRIRELEVVRVAAN